MFEIKVDPAQCGSKELAIIASMFNELSRMVATETIAHADNPATGTDVSVKAILPPPPIDAPAPTSVFGSATLPADTNAVLPSPSSVFGTAPLPNGIAPASVPAALVSSPSGVVPPSTAATAAPGVELDANGLPWDVRIHSETKAKVGKNKDTWRLKRGVDAALVAHVEAELKALMAIPNGAGGALGVASSIPAHPNTVTAPPPPPPPPVFVAASPALPAQIGSSAISIPPAPTAAIASPSSGGITTYVELATAMTSAQASGKVTMQECGAILFEVGVQSLPILAARPDLVPAVGAKLQALLASKGG